MYTAADVAKYVEAESYLDWAVTVDPAHPAFEKIVEIRDMRPMAPCWLRVAAAMRKAR